MKLNKSNLPLRLPLKDDREREGGLEYRLKYEDLGIELKKKIEGLDNDSILVQVNINEDGIGLVFEEVL